MCDVTISNVTGTSCQDPFLIHYIPVPVGPGGQNLTQNQSTITQILKQDPKPSKVWERIRRALRRILIACVGRGT